MTYSLDDSKRIKALRRDLIAAVPRFPNNTRDVAGLAEHGAFNE